jgi:hypothetical protein
MKYFKTVRIMFLAACAFLAAGCNYLDLVPEGDPTLETAFSNRVNSEKYLFTCFSRLPNPVATFNYPALIGGDEIWWDYDNWPDNTNQSRAIALGYQESNNPCLNFWDGERGAGNLFQAIRDCNIFLENIHSPYDIEEYEREQWIAEVKFLKAYYHFFLMQLYGPIPVIRENLPVSASGDEVRLYREPVDDVIEYIVQLLDEAVVDLPMEILSPANDAGRITKPIALAVKAKVLVWAASPLLNGDERVAPEFSLIDNRNVQLFPRTYSVEKWRKAAIAIRNAIDTCHIARHTLYHYIPGALSTMSPEIQLNYTLRNAVTEKFNSEIVWPATQNLEELQRWCMPLLEMGNYGGAASELGATLKIAEQYYTRNGLPINEDPDWDYAGRYATQTAGADHKAYIKTGETTAKLNFDREPRFYASLGFDRGIFEGSGRTDEASYYYIQGRQGEAGGMRSQGQHIVTGYHIKKLICPTSAWIGNTTGYTMIPYSYPLIRLTDLFLLYAEALNEIDGPSDEIYQWIDTVRLRAGIPGIEESYSRALPEFRNKPYEKNTLREIIKRERLIELAFEGQRFWDLRRWKDAFRYYNEPVRGWSYKASSVNGYYQVANIWERVFNTRDYFWPLKIHSIIVNSNLVQNPGW